MVAAWERQVWLGCLWVQGGVGQETGRPGSSVPELGVQGSERPGTVSDINSSYSMKLPGVCKPQYCHGRLFQHVVKAAKPLKNIAALRFRIRTRPSIDTEN